VSTNWLLDRRIEGFCALHSVRAFAQATLRLLRNLFTGARVIAGDDSAAEDVVMET
jgi:hypothetical protein